MLDHENYQDLRPSVCRKADRKDLCWPQPRRRSSTTSLRTFPFDDSPSEQCKRRLLGPETARRSSRQPHPLPDPAQQHQFSQRLVRRNFPRETPLLVPLADPSRAINASTLARSTAQSSTNSSDVFPTQSAWQPPKLPRPPKLTPQAPEKPARAICRIKRSQEGAETRSLGHRSRV
ncbi:hypothetical protein CPLU01_08392 [Colletotrichum plurivorum]|uniref:Uncharacterized protein n=1 Tax=Colletotrichum plurivorum TaxID=2175906 RepID=A0A8H6KCX1_9PEZI|nr:hypothetical protein CPLU01_08392 [Colletotrichum plurivorum]